VAVRLEVYLYEEFQFDPELLISCEEYITQALHCVISPVSVN
jgi:hypothetical protein